MPLQTCSTFLEHIKQLFICMRFNIVYASRDSYDESLHEHKTPVLSRFCMCIGISDVYASIDGSGESVHVYRLA